MPSSATPHGLGHTTALAVCEARKTTALLERQTVTQLGLLHVGQWPSFGIKKRTLTRLSSNTVRVLSDRESLKIQCADLFARSPPPRESLLTSSRRRVRNADSLRSGHHQIGNRDNTFVPLPDSGTQTNPKEVRIT